MTGAGASLSDPYSQVYSASRRQQAAACDGGQAVDETRTVLKVSCPPKLMAWAEAAGIAAHEGDRDRA